jgi:hypothetical protein
VREQVRDVLHGRVPGPHQIVRRHGELIGQREVAVQSRQWLGRLGRCADERLREMVCEVGARSVRRG